MIEIITLKTQLFRSEDEVKTRTWRSHRCSGTFRGAKPYDLPPDSRTKKLGRAWLAMKSICENVNADPVCISCLQYDRRRRRQVELTYVGVHPQELFICPHIATKISNLRM
jgi:hypothetical protein